MTFFIFLERLHGNFTWPFEINPREKWTLSNFPFKCNFVGCVDQLAQKPKLVGHRIMML